MGERVDRPVVEALTDWWQPGEIRRDRRRAAGVLIADRKRLERLDGRDPGPVLEIESGFAGSSAIGEAGLPDVQSRTIPR